MLILLFLILFVFFEFVKDLLLFAFIVIGMPIACFLDWYFGFDKEKDDDVQN